jgi:hypothetical protein
MSDTQTTTPSILTPYCSKGWADAWFGRYLFNETWDNSSDEKKISALCHATDFIDTYVSFYSDDTLSEEVSYDHCGDDVDDFENAVNPQRLKQACALEAAYLLSLDDNPAEPHPLTTLALLKFDGKQVDKDLVPPIFPDEVRQLLLMLNARIDPNALGGVGMSVLAKYPS